MKTKKALFFISYDIKHNESGARWINQSLIEVLEWTKYQELLDKIDDILGKELEEFTSLKGDCRRNDFYYIVPNTINKITDVDDDDE